MKHSFGEEFKYDEFNLVEHYAYYDRPLSFLLHHVKSDSFYLVNLHEERKVDGLWEIEEVFTLLTPHQVTLLQESQATIRELAIEGLNSEIFLLTMKGFGDDWEPILSPIDEEKLYRDILIDEEIWNFKAGE